MHKISLKQLLCTLICLPALCSLTMAEVSLPLDTNWQTIINANPAGTTYRIESGVHREQTVYPQAGDTYLAEPGVTMKGSKIITGAQQDSSTQLWYFTGQNQSFIWFYYGSSNTRQQNCGNDLFVDGERLSHAETLAEVDATGEFYFDEDSDIIWMYDDPTGKTVEAITRQYAFYLADGKDDVTIEGFTITQYGSLPRPIGAVYAEFADNLTFRWMEVSWCHSTGAKFGIGADVSHCRFTDNGQMGFGVSFEDVYIGSCEIANNGFHAPMDGETGALKVAISNNVLFENNWIYDNKNFGIWFDIENQGSIIRSNLVENHFRQIYFEVSGRGDLEDANQSEIYWNTVQNGSENSIDCNSSSNVDIYENLLLDNLVGLRVHFANRSDAQLNDDGLLCNVNVWGNVVRSTSKNSYVDDQVGSYEFITYFDYNTYFDADNFQADSTTYSFSNWQVATGYDSNSTYSATGTPEIPSSATPFKESPYGPQTEGMVFLSDLIEIAEVPGRGRYHRNDLAVDGATMTINGVVYEKGIGMHSENPLAYNPASITYTLGGQYSFFKATVGLDDIADGTVGLVSFEVYVDGILAYDSGNMDDTSAAQDIVINVTGARELKLVVTDGGNNTSWDQADWADARLIVSESGLAYSYFEIYNMDSIDDITGTPVDTGVCAVFDISDRDRDDNFAFSYSGFIEITREGTYTFYTNSDNGSNLSIEGVEIVDNDGLHPAEEASGSIYLGRGIYPISVLFFERGGGQLLEVSYSGPSITKQLISASVLTHLE